jgi:hypothetical protein
MDGQDMARQADLKLTYSDNNAMYKSTLSQMK